MSGLSDYVLNMFAMRQYARENTEEFDKRHVMRALSVAIEERLTDTQRLYILDRYADHMTIKEIAEKRGVDTSTVSRTIKRARENLWEVMRYTCPAFLNASMPDMN